MTLVDMEPIARINAIVATIGVLVSLNQGIVSANKAILDHVAIDHVQKDFTAWVANKPAFHVLQDMVLAIISMANANVNRGSLASFALILVRRADMDVAVWENVTVQITQSAIM